MGYFVVTCIVVSFKYYCYVIGMEILVKKSIIWRLTSRNGKLFRKKPRFTKMCSEPQMTMQSQKKKKQLLELKRRSKVENPGGSCMKRLCVRELRNRRRR